MHMWFFELPKAHQSGPWESSCPEMHWFLHDEPRAVGIEWDSENGLTQAKILPRLLGAENDPSFLGRMNLEGFKG